MSRKSPWTISAPSARSRSDRSSIVWTKARTGTPRASSLSDTCRPVLPCLPPAADVTRMGFVMASPLGFDGTVWYQITGNVWYRLVPSQGSQMAVKPVVKSRADEGGEVPVRQRLLEAAFSAFMEQGFAKTSTLEIATRARASKRELCANFGSKQEILAVCIAERAKRLRMPADLPRAARPRSAGVGADHVRKQYLAGDQQSHRDRGVPSCNRRGGPRAR